MADLSTFEQYYKLADMLIEMATKEQVAESARLLALNLRTTRRNTARYHWKTRLPWSIWLNLTRLR